MVRAGDLTRAGWLYFYGFRPLVYFMPIGIIAGTVGWVKGFGLCEAPDRVA